MPASSLMSLSYLRFRHLMLIDLLVEHGTLHKVAKILNITQPAATGMLNDLEALIGLTLFTRSRQGVAPTEAAAAVLNRCRIILNEFEDLTSTITRVAQGEQPLLRVGIVPQAFVAYFPQTVERFLQAGGCAITTREATARQLLDALLEGQLDCVVGRLPPSGMGSDHADKPLHFLKLYEEDICIVAGPDNPLVDQKSPSFQQLVECSWVLQQPDSSVRGALSEAFLRKGVQLPNPVVETSTYIQNLSLVANSQLLTVAPRRPAEMQQALGLVRILDVPLVVSPMQVGLISRASAGKMPALTLFQQCFVDSVEEDRLRNLAVR